MSIASGLDAPFELAPASETLVSGLTLLTTSGLGTLQRCLRCLGICRLDRMVCVTDLSTTNFMGVPARSPGAGDAIPEGTAGAWVFGAVGAVGGGPAARRGSEGGCVVPLGTAEAPLTGFSAAAGAGVGAEGVPALEAGGATYIAGDKREQ